MTDVLLYTIPAAVHKVMPVFIAVYILVFVDFALLIARLMVRR